MRANRHWRLALILAGACGLAGAAVVPYVYALTPSRVPMALALAASGVQTAILCFLMAWAGLAVGRAIGLDAPLLRGWRDGTALPANTRRTLMMAAGAGAIVGFVLVGCDRLLPASAMPAGPSVARWKSALSCSYGGLVEEIELRLFVMTLLARLAVIVARRRAFLPSLAWLAIVAAALIFGAGHLPLAAKLGPLTFPVVARVLALNGIAGAVYGWLFWRRGLEHAMLAHFATDIVFHVMF